MSHGVGHHDVVPHRDGDVGRQQAQPVGLLEPADAAHHVTVGRELDDLVVPGVGDQHPARPRHRPGQRHRRGREAQVGRLDHGRHVRRVARLQGAALAVDGHQLGEQGRDRVGVPLTGVLRDDVALRVDQDQRRPGAGGVGLPRDQVGVVEHGVVHAVALDGRGEGDRVGLVDELRGVHPDDDQLLGVLRLHRSQLVEHVQAVDAAEGPEVQQHEASAQARHAQRAVGVEPAAADELGGADGLAPGCGGARGAGRGGRAHPRILSAHPSGQTISEACLG